MTLDEMEMLARATKIEDMGEEMPIDWYYAMVALLAGAVSKLVAEARLARAWLKADEAAVVEMADYPAKEAEYCVARDAYRSFLAATGVKQ